MVPIGKAAFARPFHLLLDGIHHSLSLTAGEHPWRYDGVSPIWGKEWCALVAAIQASADQ